MAGTGGTRPGAGRPKGRRNNRTLEAEAYAQSLMELPGWKTMIEGMITDRTMSPDLIKTILAYRWGKPGDMPRAVEINTDEEGRAQTIKVIMGP